MRKMLESRGFEVVRLDRAGARGRASPADSWKRLAPGLLRSAWRTARAQLTRACEWGESLRHERRTLFHARQRAVLLSRRIEAVRPDVLMGCCISTMLFGLETRVPILYFSDATARIINDTYPRYQQRSPVYKRLCDAYERSAMSQASAAVFASRCARDSAVIDYRLDPARAHVAPMGANITPRDLPAALARAAPDPPARTDLRLCIIASDARRKRVGMAVEMAARLRALGWNASLTHIGEPCRDVLKTPFVHTLGAKRLSSAADRAAVAAALARSHFLLQPSIGEAYGIAPCEAAHFGRPSVVSAAGGLPEVVRHGRTGLVLPLRAGAAEYVGAIIHLARDAAAYRRMSRAALQRAREVLNWEAWMDRVAPLLRSLATARFGEETKAIQVDTRFDGIGQLRPVTA